MAAAPDSPLTSMLAHALASADPTAPQQNRAMTVTIMRAGDVACSAASSAAGTATSQGMEEFNRIWLDSLPQASRVLECGCGDGLLGWFYKQRFPQAIWCGVDRDPVLLAKARGRLDRLFHADLETGLPEGAGSGFDLLVLGDLAGKLRDPMALLRQLRRFATADARLMCWFTNSSQAGVVEQLLAGDLGYRPGGWPEPGQRRLFSPRSFIKLLVESGWLPRLCAGTIIEPGNRPLAIALSNAAASMAMPVKAVSDNLLMHRLVTSAVQTPWVQAPGAVADVADVADTAKSADSSDGSDVADAAPAGKPAISIVVAVNNEQILAHDLLASPGLAELDAEIIVCRQATSAAAAFEAGLAAASKRWVMFCHQDLWLAPGFGAALARLLDGVAPAEAATELIGLAGIGVDDDEQLFLSGFTVEALGLFDFPASSHAVSIDELAIIVSRDTVHRIDAALGWHLWGTDLCLQAEQREPLRPARIVRLPVYHNSRFDGHLPAAFETSADLLLAKYPQHDIIASLCKCLSRA